MSPCSDPESRKRILGKRGGGRTVPARVRRGGGTPFVQAPATVRTVHEVGLRGGNALGNLIL